MNNITFHTPEIFAQFPELVAGITVSNAPVTTDTPYLESNFGIFLLPRHLEDAALNDETAHVIEARKALAHELLDKDATISFVHQVHGATIVEALQEDDILGSIEADSLVTSQPNHMIGVVLADCGGILLYDPHAKVIAAVHSGWRGTKEAIVSKTIQKMQTMGADAEHIYAYISPTPCADHYEVKEDFGEHFNGLGVTQKNGSHYFNNAEVIESQLRNAGVIHIEIDPTCTVEDSSFHSYRRDRDVSGRFVAAIGLCAA